MWRPCRWGWRRGWSWTRSTADIDRWLSSHVTTTHHVIIRTDHPRWLNAACRCVFHGDVICQRLNLSTCDLAANTTHMCIMMMLNWKFPRGSFQLFQVVRTDPRRWSPGAVAGGGRVLHEAKAHCRLTGRVVKILDAATHTLVTTHAHVA